MTPVTSQLSNVTDSCITVDAPEMPNDSHPHTLVKPPPDEEGVHVFRPPSPEPTGHTATHETRALVDGVGVYTAPASSPFLTAPPSSKAASAASESTAADSPDGFADQLSGLTEPLTRRLRGFPLRLRLNEEELSGLVRAVLDLIADHLAIMRNSTRRKH
jgi:hypothetical protein